MTRSPHAQLTPLDLLTPCSDPAGLVDEVRRLAAEGVRVLTYVTPHLRTESALFEEAAHNGFLLMAADGRVLLHPESGSSSGTIDLTHPAAFDWYKGKHVANETLPAIRNILPFFLR